METEIKKCLACNKTLRGRADKKFCDDYCRSNYNNLQKIKDKPDEFVKNINNTLLKNRKILLSILPETEEMAKVTADKLLEKGFVFKYHTHTYKNKKDQVYFFCYEYGYLPLGENWYLVVRRKEG
jgi:hypothetical protein